MISNEDRKIDELWMSVTTLQSLLQAKWRKRRLKKFFSKIKPDLDQNNSLSSSL